MPSPCPGMAIERARGQEADHRRTTDSWAARPRAGVRSTGGTIRSEPAGSGHLRGPPGRCRHGQCGRSRSCIAFPENRMPLFEPKLQSASGALSASSRNTAAQSSQRIASSMIAAAPGAPFGRHSRPCDHSPRHRLTGGIRACPAPHREPCPSPLGGHRHRQSELDQNGARAQAADLAGRRSPSALPLEAALLPRFDDRAPLPPLFGGFAPADRAGVPFCHVSLTV